MKKWLVTFVFLAVLGGGLFIGIKWYSYIFAEKVYGQIFQIERVTQPAMILGTRAQNSPESMYSFAVAIRTKSGEIVTASSVDRQWALARRGMCVQAKFYPYPPWNFEKSGTFFNARLKKLEDCSEEFQFDLPEEPVKKVKKEEQDPPLIGTPEDESKDKAHQPGSDWKDDDKAI